MDIETYLEKRRINESAAPQTRQMCLTCFQTKKNCYCSHIKKFNPQIIFIILIHPLEARRRIATGRMSHLCLENSELIMGHDYSNNNRVNKIIENDDYSPVLLYPGIGSSNITHIPRQDRSKVFDSDKKLVIFVVDGTWNTAKKMVRLSNNLNKLPKICFTPPAPSNFRVRQQPKEYCYSTLEAIHHTIELLGDSQGFNTVSREHDNLIYAFDQMVENQLEYVRGFKPRHKRKIS